MSTEIPSLTRAARIAPAAPLLVALAAVLLGCATAGGGMDEPVDRRDLESIVEVTNYNWSDVHVYVMSGGQRFSLGMVTTNSTERFDLPRQVFGGARDLVFLADPVGSVLAYVSEPVIVHEGDLVEWRIQNDLSQSSISVF